MYQTNRWIDKVTYLSNIRALKGLSAVSFGDGILWTMAFKISIMPIPSFRNEKSTKISHII